MVKECVSLEGQVARTFGAMCVRVAQYAQGSPSRKYGMSRIDAAVVTPATTGSV